MEQVDRINGAGRQNVNVLVQNISQRPLLVKL